MTKTVVMVQLNDNLGQLNDNLGQLPKEMGIHNDRVGELMVLAIYVGDMWVVLLVEVVVGEKMNVEVVWVMVEGVIVAVIVVAATVKVEAGSSKVKVAVADVVVVVVGVGVEMGVLE